MEKAAGYGCDNAGTGSFDRSQALKPRIPEENIRKNPNKTVKSGTEYGIQSIRPALKRLERDPAKKTRKKSNHISPGTESAAGRRPETRSPPTAESSFP